MSGECLRDDERRIVGEKGRGTHGCGVGVSGSGGGIGGLIILCRPHPLLRGAEIVWCNVQTG